MSLMNFMQKISEVAESDGTAVCRMRPVMGTFVGMEANAADSADAALAVEEAFADMRSVESFLSRYSYEGIISVINRRAGSSPVTVPSELFALIERCLKISDETEGAFDITVNPLMKLWESSEEMDRLPRTDEVRQTLSLVGHTGIMLESGIGRIAFRTAGMALDLGGVGKGYAVDRAVEIMKKRNVERALVNAGGNIFYYGDGPSAIGITDPSSPGEIAASVHLSDGAISTSGGYERAFRVAGSEYCHIIDPRTGYPVDNGVMSVSAISSSAERADAISTAAYVLGCDDGMRLIEDTDGVEGIIIMRGFGAPRLCVSSGLALVS